MISRAKGKELEIRGKPHTRSPETGRTDASGEPVMKLQTRSDNDFHEVQNLIKFLIISQAAPTFKLTENSCNHYLCSSGDAFVVKNGSAHHLYLMYYSFSFF